MRREFTSFFLSLPGGRCMPRAGKTVRACRTSLSTGTDEKEIIMPTLHKTSHQYRRTPWLSQVGLYCALSAACLMIRMPVASAQSGVGLEVEPRDIRSLNLTEKRALAVTIQKKLQSVVDHMRPFPGQAPCTTVQVTFETEMHNEVLVIDLGAANGWFSQSADMSELGGALIEPAIEILDGARISHPAFDFEFGGRDISYYDIPAHAPTPP